MGMVRDMLVSSCSPDWGHVERFATDLDLKLDEDTGLLTEKLFLGPTACLAYCTWWYRARVDFSIPVESFLNPPAVKPDRKDPFSKFHKYGLMCRCYDLVRQKVSPIPFGEKAVRLTFDVVSSRIWSRSYQWLDKIERTLWKSAVVLLWLWRRKAPRVLLVGYSNKTVSASEMRRKMLLAF